MAEDEKESIQISKPERPDYLKIEGSIYNEKNLQAIRQWQQGKNIMVIRAKGVLTNEDGIQINPEAEEALEMLKIYDFRFVLLAEEKLPVLQDSSLLQYFSLEIYGDNLSDGPEKSSAIASTPWLQSAGKETFSAQNNPAPVLFENAYIVDPNFNNLDMVKEGIEQSKSQYPILTPARFRQESGLTFGPDALRRIDLPHWGSLTYKEVEEMFGKHDIVFIKWTFDNNKHYEEKGPFRPTFFCRNPEQMGPKIKSVFGENVRIEPYAPPSVLKWWANLPNGPLESNKPVPGEEINNSTVIIHQPFKYKTLSEIKNFKFIQIRLGTNIKQELLWQWGILPLSQSKTDHKHE